MTLLTEISPDDFRPDLFIGLVGAAGTDLDPVKTQITAQLASFKYDTREVKLSQLIGGFCGITTDGVPEDERIKNLMDGGDKIRAAYGGGDGVVCLAVAAIRKLRSDESEAVGRSGRGVAYIIDSLKNPSEIKTLDALYGRNFYAISVYSSEQDRRKRLANRIAKSCSTNVRQEHKDRAKMVIKEDEKRNSGDLSQDVQNTFPKADFFVEANGDAEVKIKRFVELIFGEPFVTPTLDEYAMFLAKAASLRSCDLSRQIGAVIIDDRDAIISTGCNDVPYPGGGMYYEGRDGPDNRDHTVEFDPNSSEITNIISELVTAFRKGNLLDKAVMEKGDDEIVTELLHGELKPHTTDARVRNLIEFGRVVHAEMHALSEAARFGRSVANARLFCTTFPCHICARHVIAAGIREVVFIEPYPKSLTKTLYEREINTDDKRGDLKNAVVFRPFQGVSPLLYQRAFSYRPRKDKMGAIVHLNRKTAIPLGASFGVANPRLEENLSAKVDELRSTINV
jgi:deoxycytidylate deaminase